MAPVLVVGLRGLPARALLAVDRALYCDVPEGDVALTEYAMPYRAIGWMVRNQGDDGRFLYRYDLVDDIESDDYNWIRHAGAMFLGRYSSESLGDYCAGPNHVLPTSRTARFSSPLGVYDFQKRSSIIHVSEAGAQTLGKVAAELAYGEGLQAHARSAELRLK